VSSHTGVVYRCALLLAAVLVLPADAPAELFVSYQYAGSFALPAGSGPLDVLANGRLVVTVGADVYVEDSAASATFSLLGPLPGADFPSFGAAFVRVSPDGTKIAVGNNGGSSFSNYQVGVFSLPSLSGTWFTASHYDGEWVDNTHVALTAGDFGSPSVVTILDTTSPNPLLPLNPTVVDNIGGASGGVAFDAADNLYTGNGFQTSGPSGTGAIKAFSLAAWTAAWTSGPPIDFETGGVLVVDVLSASPMGFDSEGHLFVGGGEFSGGDVDFAALVSNQAVANALAGMGAADPNDPAEVRKLDPDVANDFNFYSANSNDLLRRLYVREGDAVHFYEEELAPFATVVVEYAPAPGQFVNVAEFSEPTAALGPPAGGGASTPNNESIVTLGGFGGYIILAFDHTVIDDPMNASGMDAIVYGNAYWVEGNPQRHWGECATIEISRDENGNGEADDAWFLIPGSHLSTTAALMEMTWDDDIDDPAYPPDDPLWLPPGLSDMWTTDAYALSDAIFSAAVVVNPGGGGIEGIFGYADYSPTLVLGDLDGDDVVDDAAMEPEEFYTRPDDPREVGMTPGCGGGDAFDIAWAVDPETGKPAELNGFDFIRITTAVDAVSPTFGEKSAEIDAVADVSPDPFGDVDGDVDIDLVDIAAMQNCFRVTQVGVDCAVFEGDADGAVDLPDVALLLERRTGPR